MNIRPFRGQDQDAVINLWERAQLLRPWNDPIKDIARKVAYQPDLFVVGECDNQLVATAMIGYDGHRGTLFYFAIDPDFQGRGLGQKLLNYAESVLTRLGCPKLNILVRSENNTGAQFYTKAGYQQDLAVSCGKRLIPDN